MVLPHCRALRVESVRRRVDVVVGALHTCMPFVRLTRAFSKNIVHLFDPVGVDQCHKKAMQTASNLPPSPLALYYNLIITPDAS
jgi:hypothetical protein